MHDNRPIDWEERQQAIDVKRSCIVQAPAGSGKTELLIQRLLSLLAISESPEEVLAITFTRKAAAEMRVRLLEALARAEHEPPPEQSHAYETWQRARMVLARDQQLGWKLQLNPARLQLMTIDSFSAFITRRMPWMARFGAQPQVSETPVELYRSAVEKLLARADHGGVGQAALEQLLSHLDNRMTLLRDMLVDMLGKRDQWLRHLLSRRTDAARELLEAGLQKYVAATLLNAHELVGDALLCELMELGEYGASNLSAEHADHQLEPLAKAVIPEKGHGLELWLALSHLILTGTGTLRKSVDKRLGFPADKSPESVEMKGRMLALFELLQQRPEVVAALAALRSLPETEYTSSQWDILKALIELLPLAVVELQEVFRMRGQVDFLEIAGAAHAALGQSQAPEELLLQLDSRIRHILIDEFQDTSYAQYDLLQLLTSGWVPGDGRTLFVVGDPMQSIYRFREADVGLYLRVCKYGLDNLPLERIVLKANFRSQAKLVNWFNKTFAALFPEQNDEVRGAVCFSSAEPVKAENSGPAVTMHGFFERQDEAEAELVLKLVRQAQSENRDGTVAVLARSRKHLKAIIYAFRQAGLRFQAQDVDSLVERPVIQDLLALTRAVLHPADRVAWLAVLRAPWCGLTLDDLLLLCGKDARATLWQLITQPLEQEDLFEKISADGQLRLQRLQAVFVTALQQRGRLSLRRLVETTWLSLHGPACIDQSDLADVEQFLSLLEKLDSGGELERLEELAERLDGLFAAPDPLAGPELQVMTIHKAKGLEFDTVILPGLGNTVRAQERALLRWLEHPDYELLLAPIPPTVEEQQDSTYQFIGSILRDKDALETLRLLYVAVTRAKSQLHLLGHYNARRDQTMQPTSGSLLAALWPVLGADFTLSPIEKKTSAPQTTDCVYLRRLPIDWAVPVMPERPRVPVAVSRQASVVKQEEALVASRLDDEARIVGIVVHAWMERMATNLPVEPARLDLDNSLRTIHSELSAHGVPVSRQAEVLGKVRQCLEVCLNSERGRWLLQSHNEAASELALNGLVDGQLVHAIIDRTFVDAAGVRWIIDYKTSSPEQKEEAMAFMQREKERYLPQLQTYQALFTKIESRPETRLALYFPMIDGWLEWKG